LKLGGATEMKRKDRRIRCGARYAVPVILLCASVIFLGTAEAADSHTHNSGFIQRAAEPYFAIADFDGDHLPDLVTVQTGVTSASESRYWVHFRLSTGAQLSFGVTGPRGGLQLAPRDVNGDHIPDLIVSTAIVNQPVAVFLNDGHGKFSLVDPAAFAPAIQDRETFLSLATGQWTDDVVGAPTRPLLGENGEWKAFSTAKKVREAILLESVLVLNTREHSPSFGRAPPNFSHT